MEKPWLGDVTATVHIANRDDGRQDVNIVHTE